MKLKCGTRTSALAWAQSQQVKKQLEALGCSVELVGIQTKGDQILDQPLWQLPGKDFFVTELDQALLAKKVDYVVHSLKDLSVDRPQGILTAALLERQNPHDVVIFSADAVNKVKQKKTLVLGSSSLRRKQLIPEFLAQALDVSESLFQMQDLRGNIDSRIERLFLPPSHPRFLDAIVLAAAGLARLSQAFERVRFLQKIWLPLSHVPCCPGQAALALECREEDGLVRDVLKKLHHPLTALACDEERAFLKKAGGGCHQPFGVYCHIHPFLGSLRFVKGVVLGEKSQQVLRVLPKPFLQKIPIFDGKECKPQRRFLNTPLSDLAEDVFIAHAHAVRDQDLDLLRTKRLWTSGVSSWFALAKRGLFVSGCAEGFGFSYLKQILEKAKERICFSVLTHQDAQWDLTAVQRTYVLDFQIDEQLQKMLFQKKMFFWTSATQFLAFRSFCPVDAVHACGPGKTAEIIKACGITPFVFLSHKEWKAWCP